MRKAGALPPRAPCQTGSDRRRGGTRRGGERGRSPEEEPWRSPARARPVRPWPGPATRRASAHWGRRALQCGAITHMVGVNVPGVTEAKHNIAAHALRVRRRKYSTEAFARARAPPSCMGGRASHGGDAGCRWPCSSWPTAGREETGMRGAAQLGARWHLAGEGRKLGDKTSECE